MEERVMDDATAPDDKRVGRARRFASAHKRALVAGGVALALVAGTGAAGLYCYQRTETAQAAEASALEEYATERSLVDETLSQAVAMLDGDSAVTSEQVSDETVLDELRAAYDEHADAATTEPDDSPSGSWDDFDSIADWFTFWDVERNLDDLESDLDRMRDERGDVDSAIFVVETSEKQRTVEDAQASLADAVTTAEATLEEVGDEVSDDDTVTALEEQLDAAREVRDASLSRMRYSSQSQCDERIQSYSDAEAALEEARAAAEDSHASYEEAQQAAAEAARSASNSASGGSGSSASSSSSSSSSTGSDTWYATYRGTDDSTQANADGSLSEWKDGYYIAHDWSSNGQMIASKPSTVVVDGVTYRYVSSMVVSRDTQWSEVRDYAYANGGIAFQTCDSSGGYLIVHYEPV